MPFSALPSSRLPRPLAGAVNRLLQIDKLERLYEAARSGGRLCPDLMRALDIDLRVTAGDIRKIPSSGPAIAVSNHPFGLLDGALLTALLTRVRPDVRVLTNRMLGDVAELSQVGIFIDPFDRPESRMANSRALKHAISHVRNGGLLLIFPAGEVAHFDFRAGAIRDPLWRSTAARLIRLTGAKAVPILVCGSNGVPFQMLGMVHPRLRTAALPSELLNKRGRAVEVRIGGAIDASHIAALADDESATRYLRLRTDLLALRGTAPGSAASASQECPAAQEPPGEIEREIAGLPAACLLEQAREMEVYMADAAQIPRTLLEIGRLREVTFRAAGEGTRQDRDLDRFDPHYQHLFVWNRERREVVGAYRIGDVPRILSGFGRKGLYTESLFRFSAGFFETLGPALELGRSFIRPEYQRQFAPLLLLWKGIAAYVWRRPEYAMLIGAVSVSNRYTPASRELIARYFEKDRGEARSGAVRPRRPLRGNLVRRWEIQALCALIPNPDYLSGPIADLEPDGKGIPVLVKQYARLGGRMLAFSVDSRFGNTLDGFVIIDLRRTDPEILARYMGKEPTHEYLAWHRSASPQVA